MGGITSCYNYWAKEFAELNYYLYAPFPRTKKTALLDYPYTGIYGNIILVYSEKYILEIDVK